MYSLLHCHIYAGAITESETSTEVNTIFTVGWYLWEWKTHTKTKNTHPNWSVYSNLHKIQKKIKQWNVRAYTCTIYMRSMNNFFYNSYFRNIQHIFIFSVFVCLMTPMGAPYFAPFSEEAYIELFKDGHNLHFFSVYGEYYWVVVI